MLLMGNSLQGTLIAIRAAGEQFSDSSIGIMTSGYFLGFVLGTLVTAYLIERAGHIRGFTALASLASAQPSDTSSLLIPSHGLFSGRFQDFVSLAFIW